MLALSRCPLCKHRPSQRWGCCTVCYGALQQELEPYRNPRGVMVLGSYRGLLKRAVQQLKYHKVTAIATLLGHQLAEAIRQEAYQHHAPLPQACCAVPLHWWRWLGRGYNQSRLLSRALARALEIEEHASLRRVRATKQQAKLSANERSHNVRGAFVLRNPPPQRYMVLVDDVVTTGVTLRACAQVLEAAGIQVAMAAVAEA